MSNDNFINQKMITYLGNKRKLIPEIETILQEVCKVLKKKKLNLLDGFAGSSVVSRLFTKYANHLYSNDLELYSFTMNQCFIIQPNDLQKKMIQHHIETMNHLAEKGPYKEGVICKLYAPKDTHNIQKEERCFYTRENALIIDTLRDYITNYVEHHLFAYCITPLLIQASIHVNTSGVFLGFHKNKETGLGQWGGTAENDLQRIKGTIKLEMPCWSKFNYLPHISNKDVNILMDEIPNIFDLIYLDPPYNMHGYSNNYFMFNVIIENKEPIHISKVSGIPVDWNRSQYNYKKSAFTAMESLLQSSLEKSKYVLLSYNNEGIIQEEELNQLFETYHVKTYEINYDTYKGGRNLKERGNKVIERMYLIQKI
tara:strand:- start:1481 stop:2587 length:1107 start_codon:yes stop_codon:yes gene_type:complete